MGRQVGWDGQVDRHIYTARICACMCGVKTVL